MTNYTIYKRAHELTFVQFCRWYSRAVRKRKTRDSNSVENVPFCVALRNEANKKKVVVRRLTEAGVSALLTYEDQD